MSPPCLAAFLAPPTAPFLWRDGGLDSVVYGPGGKWIAHQVDEFVEVAEIIQATEVFANAALAFLHS